MYDGAIYTWTRGRVADVLNRGIEGAFLREDYAPREYTWSDNRGDYELRIWSHCPTTITASHDRFDSVTSEQVGVATPFVGPEFRLLYQIKAPSASPRAINPSPTKSISFEVPAGPLTLSEAQVRLQLPTGEPLDLQPDGFVGSLGRWTGSWTTPESLADGVYSYKACVVSPGATGNCDTLSSGVVMSLATAGSFIVDRVAPSISALKPTPNRNTLDTTPTLSFAVSDALSGVNASALTIDLNGVRVATGGNSYTPSAPLPPGLHSVFVTASDLAGNTTAMSWQFNITEFSVTNTSTHLFTQTVQVNPDGVLLNPPQTVTFRNVGLRLDPYEVQLGPAAFAGAGHINRTAYLDEASVIFENETGVPSEPVRALLSPWITTAKFALLFPEPTSTVATIGEQRTVLAAVTVSVPAGYNTPGSTATLRMNDKVVTTFQLPDAHDPLPSAIDFKNDPPLVSISSQDAVRVQKAGADWMVSAMGGTVGAYATVNGERKELLTPRNYDYIPDPDIKFSDPPSFKCNGHPADPPSDCIANGGNPLAMTRSYMAVGRQAGVGFGGYANYWLYEASGAPSRFIAWHQINSVVQDSACIGGERLVTTLLNSTTKTSQTVPDPSSQKSAWEIEAAIYSDSGTELSTGSGRYTSTPELPWLTNAVTGTAEFNKYAVVDPIPYNNDDLGLVSTGLSLGPGSQELRGVTGPDNEKMIVGAVYKPRGGSQPLLSVSSITDWNFEVRHAAC